MLLIQKSIVLDEILLKCKNKDKTAQNKLFEKLAPRMLGICFRYIADRSEAEHIMIGGWLKFLIKSINTRAIVLLRLGSDAS